MSPGGLSPSNGGEENIGNAQVSSILPPKVVLAEGERAPGDKENSMRKEISLVAPVEGCEGSGRMDLTVTVLGSLEGSRRITLQEKVTVLSDKPQKSVISKSSGSTCPYLGCVVKTRSLRAHVNLFHLPKLLHDKVTCGLLNNPAFHAKRVEALGLLRQWLLGSKGPVEDLLSLKRDPDTLKPCYA